ncbi:hypothetical protein [Deinococcus altitudinis]
MFGLPQTIDALALDEALFWAARAQEINADTRRTVHRREQAKTRTGNR